MGTLCRLEYDDANYFPITHLPQVAGQGVIILKFIKEAELWGPILKMKKNFLRRAEFRAGAKRWGQKHPCRFSFAHC